MGPWIQTTVSSLSFGMAVSFHVVSMALWSLRCCILLGMRRKFIFSLNILNHLLQIRILKAWYSSWVHTLCHELQILKCCYITGSMLYSISISAQQNCHTLAAKKPTHTFMTLQICRPGVWHPQFFSGCLEPLEFLDSWPPSSIFKASNCGPSSSDASNLSCFFFPGHISYWFLCLPLSLTSSCDHTGTNQAIQNSVFFVRSVN